MPINNDTSQANQSLNMSHNLGGGSVAEDNDESMVVIKSGLDDSSSAFSRYSQTAKRENRKKESAFSYQLAM